MNLDYETLHQIGFAVAVLFGEFAAADPAFSNTNWIGMGGIPGANGRDSTRRAEEIRLRPRRV